MNEYQKFIALSRYARWLDGENRRETWEETVQRFITFFVNRCDIKEIDYNEIFEAIYNLEVMPSMRALMTAGLALDKDNMAGFNCSYIAMDHPRAFDEMMYILMCGTGVGFSVERQYVSKLPEIDAEFHETDTVIIVDDSKIGWSKAFKELISLLYMGQIPSWDTSKLRGAGAKLKTFGGRSSGPEPLHDLFKFTVDIFRKAAGRRLTSLEVHDICCKIGDIVVVGGVRRSALLSLSNLSDDRMRRAKSGEWWNEFGHRRLANNSACYTEKPDFESFLAEWTSLYESKSGERGVFSRIASQKQAGKNGRRNTAYEFGTNPCSEIILRPQETCNLSEVVVRENDTIETLKNKVRIATILGTIQSTLTNFRYVRQQWKKNCEEERLLGVSLTGIMDHPVLGNANNPQLPDILECLRQIAIDTNKTYSELLGINQSTAITCVKPSGTVSQLVDSASGIHPRFSKYYIRRVRADKKDPLSQFMVNSGFPYEEDVTNNETLVFDFPQKAPESSIVVKDITAMEQLKLWKIYQDHWCEHKPSITVYYKDTEFLEIGQWLYNNFDSVSGISFLPYSDHIYKQAPYEAIAEDQYNYLLDKMPKNINWSDLANWEKEDTTTGTQELACVGTSCEIR